MSYRTGIAGSIRERMTGKRNLQHGAGRECYSKNTNRETKAETKTDDGTETGKTAVSVNGGLRHADDSGERSGCLHFRSGVHVRNRL